ncbi:transketolase [Myceligenerans cantabricum]
MRTLDARQTASHHDATDDARLRIRERIIDLCAGPDGGHLGGAMSLTEILAALYLVEMRVDPERPDLPDRDVLVLSKGHGALALYATLAECGFLDDDELDRYGTAESNLLAHPHPETPGVEVATGSLGHGLAIGVGVALGARLAGRDSRCFVILGDGELQEGSVWEAASVAASLGLDNLTAVVDRNGLQITGATEEVQALEPLVDRWQAFGWHGVRTPGHDVDALLEWTGPEGRSGRPRVIVADTVKGHGVPFIEGNPKSHFAKLSERQARRARLALRGPAALRGAA